MTSAASTNERAARERPPIDTDRRGLLLRAIEAFQAGVERDANFGLLFDAYYRPLRRFFARKGLAEETCLDLTQETFLGIYRGLEGYRPEARLEAWLYRIATTTYLKWVRSRTAEKRSGIEVATESLPAGEETLGVEGGQLERMLSEEDRRVLREAVGELPEQMRRCLKLRLYHELTYREIAAVLKISIQTVKAHLFQARQRLERGLGPASGDST